MGLSTLELALLCIMGLVVVHPTHAQNSPQDFVNVHNVARTQVGVGPLTWDNNLAMFAQNYTNTVAATCSIAHSGGPYGENIYRSSGNASAATAVNKWVAEKIDYNYNTNTCNTGKVCGHYTQVVWRNSVRVGCGRVRCSNGGSVIVCDYDPRGNFVGQRPY